MKDFNEAQDFEGSEVTLYITDTLNYCDLNIGVKDSFELRISQRAQFQAMGFSKRDSALTANEHMRATNGGLKIRNIDLRRKLKIK